MEGRRVDTSSSPLRSGGTGGRRTAESTGALSGTKLGLAAAALVVVSLVSGYLGLCTWVGSSLKILPNITIQGVEVSGMTPNQAVEAVEQAVEQYGKTATVTLQCQGWSGTLSCADLQPDTLTAVATAVNIGRSSFLGQGAEYLRRLSGADTGVPLMSGSLYLAQPAVDRLVDQANEVLDGGVRQAAWAVEGDTLTMTKGRSGTSLNRDAVARLAAEAADQALSASIAQGGAPVDVPVDLAAQEGTLGQLPPRLPDFQAVRQAVYVQARDAELDGETLQVLEHVTGVDFDVEALQLSFAAAGEGETVSVPLILTQPAETRESLSAKLFADVLGRAVSKLDNNKNRSHNVKLAAEACNGTILLPGQVFSYNDTTGSRTAEMGYLPSTIYVGGRTEEGIGGGVCQPSSTIYYAVLQTTLEVVERHNHKFAVGYVPDGMDATVYYGSLDFRFKNSTPYPLKIVTELSESQGTTYLTATLYGTNPDGRYAESESAVYDWVSPTDSYVADNSVPRGTLVLDREQNAYTGRKATTYRYIYESNGTLVEKQNMGTSKYAMRPRLYHYNPADGDPSTWVDGKPPVPKEEITPPVEETTPTPPVEETTPPVEETTPPVEEQTAPNPAPEEQVPPVEEGPQAPGQAEPPVQNETGPAEQTQPQTPPDTGVREEPTLYA